jgi:hypothetical protein
MVANGVREQLIIDIFHEAVNSIKGLKLRVKRGQMSKEDRRLISATEVSFSPSPLIAVSTECFDQSWIQQGPFGA